MDQRPETRAVHAGRKDLFDLGVHALPLDFSTTYPIGDLEAGTVSIDHLVDGGGPVGNPIYARLHNPTVARFESALAALEGGQEAVAFGSGMATITACLLAAAQRGRHVVAIRPLYGTTDHLLTSGLLGIEVSWVKESEIGSAIREDTSLVILETPGNPTLALVDIEQVVADAGSVPVLVDSTFATPVLQQPLSLGATFALHSATKFLGGHGDVMGGVVATNAYWAHELRKVRIATGGLLHPLAAYLIHRGLATLTLRVERGQSTAHELARRLLRHPAVSWVGYPAIGDHRGLVGSQMRGPGALVAFEMAGGYQAAASLIEHLELITPAVSLGCTDTLIQHPAGLTHRMVEPEARRMAGIRDGVLRLSVGLEHVEDLWTDLASALEKSSARRAA